MTKSPTAPKPFVIDNPGKYLTRDGFTVVVRAVVPADGLLSGWVWIAVPGTGPADGESWRDDGSYGFNPARIHPRDIIAHAPARPVSKSRPAKGKKAKRRYYVMRLHACWYVKEEYSTRFVQVESRALARRVCAMLNGAAMKEAQRGGA